MDIHFLELLHKNNAKMGQQINLRQNTVCFEQQIYLSPENVTPLMVVVLVTLRMSSVV